mmetsp:Transcript_9232/g.10537  ORF Transcript_9232/g.10537 Transcript_9232/m.10537 type:complete len:504 (-) Transcript_9232:144-1655(-)|eukprot:CAMPEP_0194169132 /NCGR_PEP_ID=MMETSP0154-20130528/3812_1 /TAXON_ID=1049557 /ORGANISM="Thalassiothrix antarctica, Strain L6-D1" /LENGTH=503 /DNA_ID=CAMNT_0038880381 /DNA_START=84 /DNA_END=1595 /DNA_ORIENTATION=+
MTSIPYDRTLVMGNLVSLQKIKNLMDVAECEKPQLLAEERMQALMLSNYKMKTISLEMENMNVPAEDLEMLNGELRRLKSSVSKAAISLARETIACQNRMFDVLDQQGQKRIGFGVESPMDYSLSKVSQFPLASDTMNFDVQYFSVESRKDSVSAHTSTVTSHIHAKVGAGIKVDAGMAMDVRNTMMSQSSQHSLEGTIVITADCNHRQADIIAPLILDPKKSVESWNMSFPLDRLHTDPVSMYGAALPPNDSELEKFAEDFFGQNAMYLLSGCTRGSSFVGFVHILKREGTNSSETASIVAGEMKVAIERNMALASMSGSFGLGGSVGQSLKNLISTSKIENHCSLVTRGVLPNIAATEMETVIRTLKPNPQEIMEQLSAINNASGMAVESDSSKGFQEMGSAARTGQQFQQLNSDFAQKTIGTIKEINTKDNKVIDANSLMNALTDYINKAQAGACGVPIAFFVKRVTKREVAASYINKYYPNGASLQKDAITGQLGAEPT